MVANPLLQHLLPQTPRDRLVFALDVDHIDEAERLVKLLAPHVGMFKVGPRLFTNAGSLVLDLINGMGSSVFLDLKFHDIPASVAGAAREVARQRVRMFTVHALGGPRMVQAVLRELSNMTLIPGAPPPIVLGVTVLTSHAQEEVDQLGFTEPIVNLATRLAKLAVGAGAQGIVASGHELAELVPALPAGTIFVTPGIRSPDDDKGDQSRVMTAKEAVKAGATYVVVGRPIRTAKDPVAAAKRFVDEIAEVHA
ncbi:MAG: orotidine-5'-phosphate decarboxylase [Myxococcales bacterium]|nr:orotidine-5'-phosphate decarboxylase [Myxococcales bacterium]